MTPEEFEQQVARIVSLLQGQQAEVQWNERIPDPDNPTQLRQVDVTIRRDGKVSLVECRLHSRPQDVQWVEELYGRRASLGAISVMGVSAAGFTAGAIKKAERLGVFLRDLRSVTDEEVKHWGRSTKVRLSYVRFMCTAIFAVASDSIVVPSPNPLTILKTSNGGPWPVEGLFRDAANHLSGGKIREGIVKIQYFTKELFLGSVMVPEITFQVDWRWLHRDLSLPYVLAFTKGGDDPGRDSEALVEKDFHSRTEVYHLHSGVCPVVDVSLAPLEEGCYLRTILIDLGQPLTLTGSGLVGLGEPQLTLIPIQLQIVRRNSPEYHALTADGDLVSLS